MPMNLVGTVSLVVALFGIVLLVVRVRRRLRGDAALAAANVALANGPSSGGLIADMVISLAIWAVVVGVGWLVWSLLVRSLMT